MRRETNIFDWVVLNKGNTDMLLRVSIDYLAAYYLYENRKYLMKDPSHKILTNKIHIECSDGTGDINEPEERIKNIKKIGILKYVIDNHDLEISPEVEVSANDNGFIVLGIVYKEDGVEYKKEVPVATLRSVFVRYGYYKR